MKIFGSISELVDLAFRLAGGKQVKLKSRTQDSNAASVTTVYIPNVSATGDQDIVLAKASQTLEAKELTSPDINGGTIDGAAINQTPIGQASGGEAAGAFTALEATVSAELQTLRVPSLTVAGVAINDGSGNISARPLLNADVDAAAAIAFSKLAALDPNYILIGSGTNVVNKAPVTGDISITFNGTNAVTAIGSGVIVDGDVSNSANILSSKILEANSITKRPIVTDNSGNLKASADSLTDDEALVWDTTDGKFVSVPSVTSTKLGYLSGVTSDIQTQLGNKAASGANNDITSLSALSTPLSPAQGGTGVNNGTSTLTLGGNLVTSGNFTTTITSSNTTNVTLPVSGTLATLAGSESLSNKTLDRLRTQASNAAISGGVLNIANGLMVIGVGENTLNSFSGATSDGAVITLLNNEGADITITNAGNLQTGTGSDFTLKNGAAASFVYSGALSPAKWVLSGGAGGAGGGLIPAPLSAVLNPAVKGTHYLTNTSSAGFSVTLPSGADGSVIRFSDANETWDLNQLTIIPASGQKIDNLATDESLVCDVKRGWVELSWNTALSSWSLQSLSSLEPGVASATQAGVVSTGAQTFAGAKTFNSQVTVSSGGLSLGNNRKIVATTVFVGNVETATYTDISIPTGSGAVSAIAMNNNFAIAGFNFLGVGTGATGTLRFYHSSASVGQLFSVAIIWLAP